MSKYEGQTGVSMISNSEGESFFFFLFSRGIRILHVSDYLLRLFYSLILSHTMFDVIFLPVPRRLWDSFHFLPR